MKSFLCILSFRSPAQPSRFVSVFRCALLLLCLVGASLKVHAGASNSIARVWNERALAAIRQDTPHPPAQARNYFSFSICMYDAWAAYDPAAVGYIYRGKHTAADVASARSNALSYAVYRMMKERHAFSKTAAATLTADDNYMTALGYNINDQSRDTSTPTGVGNTIYDQVSLWFSNDGSRQTNGTPYPGSPIVAYPDAPQPPAGNGYVYTNPALATDLPGIDDGPPFHRTVVDINHWQRLQVVGARDQNGFTADPLQPYLGAQWLGVRPFSLVRTDPTKPWIDPGPPPFFGGPTHTQFVKEVVACITADGQLDPDDGVMIDISPAVYGNNSLDFAGDYGTGNFEIYDGHGYTTNPVTGGSYSSNMVKRGDLARVLAEFWADGPTSETPPGHWNVLGNYVADHLAVKRIGGTGSPVDDLEWDVKMYFSLNAALHDAACACWSAKRAYDGYRPMSAVRYLAGLGQSTDPGLPSYNANGLPLITNQIELVTAASAAFGGRHEGLTPGKIAVLAWPGPPAVPSIQHSGVKWIHGESWSTYQRTNFVTPAFPGYFSGHSTFSRSAAEILTELTGSPYFPGGLGTFANYTLGFEQGPSVPMTLQWASYYDAADQAGISRIWGGIHVPIDNIAGRHAGAQVGKDVWALVKRYWDGSVTNTPVTITRLNSSQYEVRYNALRGFYYDFKSTLDASQTFTNDPPGTSQPFDALSVARTNSFSDPMRYHRAVSRFTP
jgi:hypothetical protein